MQEQEVWSGEPSREPLKSLRPLRNELKAISIILERQSDALQKMRGKIHWTDFDPFPYTNIYDYAYSILDEGLSAAENRKEVVKQLDALGTDLRTQVSPISPSLPTVHY